MNRNSNNTGLADLQDIFYRYLKYWKWIVVSIIVCGLLAFFYARTLEIVYKISASTVLRSDDGGGLSSLVPKSNSGLDVFGGTSGSVEDDALIMKAYSSMRNMAYDLDLYKSYKSNAFLSSKTLYNNSPIELDAHKSVVDTLSASLLFKVKKNAEKQINVEVQIENTKLAEMTVSSFPSQIETPYGLFVLKETAMTPKQDLYNIEISVIPLDLVAESLQKKIIAEPAHRKSEILALEIEDVVPQRGIDILNYVIKLYNDKTLEEKNEVARNSIYFMEERIKALAVEVDSIEDVIIAFKKENKLIDVGSTAGSFFGRYQSSIDRAVGFDVQNGILNMLDNYISNPQNKFTLIPIASQIPEGALDVVTQYNSAILERERLLKNGSETNPVVIALETKIKSLHEGVKLTVESMKKDFDLQRSYWNSFDSEMAANMIKMPQKEQEYMNIERQRQIKSGLYLFLLNKKEETQLMLASGGTNAKIIDNAYKHSLPVGPRKLLILGIGMFIGLFVSIAVIYLKILLKTKISSKEELKEYTDIPILGEICLNKTEDNIVVKDGDNTAISELFRLVRTNLQFMLKKDKKVIVVTSSISGEGKTFFTMNLALSFSLMKNKKVILVGLDIRNPKLSEYFSIKNNNGLTTFLASDEINPQGIILHKPELHANFYVIPSGPVPPNPSELLLGDKLEELFVYLRNNFDYIIVDTAPTAMVSDTFTLDRISDFTLFLFRADYTNKSYLKLIDSYLDEKKLKDISLVINGVTTKNSYGYGYGVKPE